jgi:hypothetical protein
MSGVCVLERKNVRWNIFVSVVMRVVDYSFPQLRSCRLSSGNVAEWELNVSRQAEKNGYDVRSWSVAFVCEFWRSIVLTELFIEVSCK